MRLEIHHYFHADERLVGLLNALNHKADVIMTTQADAAKTLSDIVIRLDAVKTVVGKVSSETTTLVQEVADLKAAAANEPVSDELQAAIAAVSSRVDSVSAAVNEVDGLVPDAPAAGDSGSTTGATA